MNRRAWDIFVWSQIREGFRRIGWGLGGAWFIIGGGLRPGSSLLPTWRRWLRLGKARR